MKQVLLIFAFIGNIVYGQDIKVTEIRQINTNDSVNYGISGISPDGKQLLVTGQNSKGLYLIDIKTNNKHSITESSGAGYEPVFSPDGRYIFYRSDEYSDNRKYSSLNKTDLNTGNSEILESKSRNLTKPVTTGKSIVYMADGQHKVKGFQNNILKSSVEETYVLTEDLTPSLFINGEKKMYKPGGDGSYIWVSLSPDKTRMLYHLVGKGTFVADLQGNILASPGKLNAPKWLNNDIIVGMDDKDDGKRIVSSDIVAFSIQNNKRINLTSSQESNEMYPFPFPGGRKIAFRTSDGNLYIMNIKIK